MSHLRFHGEARHTWKGAVARWGQEILPGLSAATGKRYLVSLRQVSHHLDALFVDQIAIKTIAKVAGRAGATNATRRRDLSAVSSVLRCCVNWGWREDNPARAYDRSAIPERRDPITLPTDDEVEAVIARAPGRFADLIRFLDLTGCRQEEAAGLEHAQLRLDRQEVLLLRTKTRRPRTIRLVNPAAPKGLAGTGIGTVRSLESAFVFHHGNGDRYANVASRFAGFIAELVKAKKIKAFRCHDLRHRFAVRWLENGGDIYDLSRHLGHSSVKTTEIYLGYVNREPAQKPAQRRRSAVGTAGRNAKSRQEIP